MADPQMRATAKALAEFDEANATINQRADLVIEKYGHLDEVNDLILALDAGMDQMAEAVGIAFGHDTDDINDMDTCRGCVRPGPWLRERIALAPE